MYVRAEHGHATNDSPDFAKLKWRAQVRPIYWNTVGNCYLDLAEPELRFLTRPFDVHGFAMSRPELDAVVIGFKNPSEIDEAIKRMNSALAEAA